MPRAKFGTTDVNTSVHVTMQLLDTSDVLTGKTDIMAWNWN